MLLIPQTKLEKKYKTSKAISFLKDNQFGNYQEKKKFKKALINKRETEKRIAICFENSFPNSTEGDIFRLFEYMEK